VGVAQFSMPAMCASKILGELFRDRAFWEQMDWDDIESSELWRNPAWNSYSGNQKRDETIIKEIERINYFGSSRICVGKNGDVMRLRGLFS
jgi:hypothetical protein